MKSISEAAEYLGYSVHGLRKIIRRGEIKYFQAKAKGPIKFKVEWLDEFIDRGTKPKAAEIRERKAKPKVTTGPHCSVVGFGFDMPMLPVKAA